MPRVLIIEMNREICHALQKAVQTKSVEATYLCPDDFNDRPAAEWIRNRNLKVDAIIISDCVPDVTAHWVVSVIESLRKAGVKQPIVATSSDDGSKGLYVNAGASAFVHRTVELNAAGGLYKALELLEA